MAIPTVLCNQLLREIPSEFALCSGSRSHRVLKSYRWIQTKLLFKLFLANLKSLHFLFQKLSHHPDVEGTK